MSFCIKKYKIVYDGNDGYTYEKSIYAKFENVWDGQLWVNEDGTPVDFGCVTDSEAMVMSMCIANIPTNDMYFYWEEVKDFTIPNKVAKVFYK